MNFGANLLPIFSFSESKNAPGVKIAPAARRTPGVFFTVGSSEALIVGISPFSCSTGFSAVTTTLVPFSDSLKISSKAARIVSVRTKEPATKATPRKTAKVVSSARTLRAQRLLRPRLVKLLLQLDYLVRRAGGGVADDPPVLQGDQPVGVGGGNRVVGDHHHRLAELVDRLAQQLEDVGAGLGVEVAGGLIGEDHGRFADQGAGDRDPLLLAAGELRGAVGAPVLEADGADELVDPLLVGIAAGDRERQHQVLLGGEDRQQVEELEDEAELVAAQLGQLAVVEAGDVDSIEFDLARGRLVEPGEDVHQGRLAGARGAHDRGEAVALEAGADAGQGVDRGVTLAVAAVEVGGNHDWSVDAHSPPRYRAAKMIGSSASSLRPCPSPTASTESWSTSTGWSGSAGSPCPARRRRCGRCSRTASASSSSPTTRAARPPPTPSAWA